MGWNLYFLSNMTSFWVSMLSFRRSIFPKTNIGYFIFQLIFWRFWGPIKREGQPTQNRGRSVEFYCRENLHRTQHRGGCGLEHLPALLEMPFSRRTRNSCFLSFWDAPPSSSSLDNWNQAPSWKIYQILTRPPVPNIMELEDEGKISSESGVLEY